MTNKKKLRKSPRNTTQVPENNEKHKSNQKHVASHVQKVLYCM